MPVTSVTQRSPFPSLGIRRRSRVGFDDESHRARRALLDPEVQATSGGRGPQRRTRCGERLDDVGGPRMQEMDEAGIDVQVLSHGAPAQQRLDAETGGAGWRAAPTTGWPRRCRAHPDRFAGFAMLPTADPKAAADELERAVTRLGFKGAMIHGLDRRPCSSTTSASGRSSSARRRSTCRSTCTRRCRTRRWSRPTTRTTSRSSPAC